MKDSALFSMCYLGPIDYYIALIQYDTIYWEKHESFPKQSYRNRCLISGPNKIEHLSIPIKHRSGQFSGDIEISYAENWPRKHLHALKTAYRTSPFYEAIIGDLENVLQKAPRTLWELNRKIHQIVLFWLQRDCNFQPTAEWRAKVDMPDFRESFHPKAKSPLKLAPYPQLFDYKRTFEPGLSIFDLLCNEGPLAYTYLLKHANQIKRLILSNEHSSRK